MSKAESKLIHVQRAKIKVRNVPAEDHWEVYTFTSWNKGDPVGWRWFIISAEVADWYIQTGYKRVEDRNTILEGPIS